MHCYLPRLRAGSVIGVAANLSWLLSVLIHPYMPGISEEIQRQLQVCSLRMSYAKNGYQNSAPKQRWFTGAPNGIFLKLKATE